MKLRQVKKIVKNFKRDTAYGDYPSRYRQGTAQAAFTIMLRIWKKEAKANQEWELSYVR